MAWTTPTEVDPGDAILASLWNTDVFANGMELAPFFGAWTSWTPTISSTAGTLTSTTIQVAKYLRVGSIVFVRFTVTITNAGTGGGGLLISQPPGNLATEDLRDNGAYREVAVTGIAGSINPNTVGGNKVLECRRYDNNTPIATNHVIAGNIFYETTI